MCDKGARVPIAHVPQSAVLVMVVDVVQVVRPQTWEKKRIDKTGVQTPAAVSVTTETDPMGQAGSQKGSG